MPNHVHLVIVQGARPLAEYMQPLLRRLAILVHARRHTEGHVFQRRFYSVPCTDPDYLRNTIAYVHLNPVRALLCRHPNLYPWTSHADYRAVSDQQLALRRGAGIGVCLFAPAAGAPAAMMRENYGAFLDWRTQMDSWSKTPQHQSTTLPPLRPTTAGGDAYWTERFGWSATSRAEGERPRRPTLDLRDLALAFLAEREPGLPLDLLRSGQRTRALVAARRQFIARAKENGHRSRSIARFLRVSDVTVCAV